MINGTTTITTDPSITTNSQTDYGKIYRGSAQDGAASDYFFGSTTAFDTSTGFNQIIDSYTPWAAFKFSNLVIAGNPTIDTSNGGATNLALVAVNGLTTAAPGGTLTFAGIDNLLLATQAGSITLTTDVSFSNLSGLFLYARGANSDLTIGSAITSVGTLLADAEGDVYVGNTVVVDSFTSAAGHDFGVGAVVNTGSVHAASIDIFAGNLLNFSTNDFAVGTDVVRRLRLNSANTINLNIDGDQTVFTNSLDTQITAPTINVDGAGQPAVLRLSGNPTSFSAGAGGINAPNVDFYGDNLTLSSAGDIDVYSTHTFLSGDFPNVSGSITADGAINASGDLQTNILSAGTSISAGGRINAGSISAGTDLTGLNGITANGGSITAGGNILTNGALTLEQLPPGTFGNITAGGDITANGGIFTPGDPVVVSAGGSITTPAVLTGTLQATNDITIDNMNGFYSFGIIANTVIAGGTLNFINSPGVSPNNGGFVGNDGETFNDLNITVGNITSSGPTFPVISNNGGDANLGFADSNPGNGGVINLTLTNSGLTIGNNDGSEGNVDAIRANGGAFNPGGPFGGGNGGSIHIVSAGDVVVFDSNDGTPGISATTGIVQDRTTDLGGQGGTASISTDATVTINGTIQVSSDDLRADSSPIPGRESESGGAITLQSNLTTGTGITVASGGSLLSLLSLDALNNGGSAGSITLSTKGADIVVNGTVRADFGTITIDQNDPAGAIPLITLDGGTLQAATFNINGSGDLDIGATSPTAINIFGGTWNVANNINLNAANTSFAYSFSLNATAGNAINFVGGNSDVPATLTLPLSDNTTFTAGAGGINAQYVDILYSGAALNLITDGDITANSITYTDYYTRGMISAGGSITTIGNLYEGDINARTTIDVGGTIQANTVTAGSTINVGSQIQASHVTAGSDISVGGTTSVQFFDTPGILQAQSISPYVFSTDPAYPEQGAKAPHVYNVDTVYAPGGIDFNGNNFGGIDGYSSGGILTINATSLFIAGDSSSAIGSVDFNGADAGTMGFDGNVFTSVGGDGGSFTVNTTSGPLYVSQPVSATTGFNKTDPQDPSAFTTNGAGGNVTLHSDSGTVTIDSTVQVSSNDPVPYSTIAPMNYRKSASGGNITISSDLGGGQAIALTDSSSLLSLLDASAPGPGGTISVQSGGGTIDIGSGLIEADRGTIDIGNQGLNGSVTLTNANMFADFIKIGAYGANGTLNIGGGALNANQMLSLYAGGSNGTINFTADVSLNSISTAALIAANTVTIDNQVVVTIGGTHAANVYTNNANYSGSGGNGSTTGTFGGAGATTQPYANRPQQRLAAIVGDAVISAATGTDQAPTGRTTHFAPPTGRVAAAAASMNAATGAHPVIQVSDSSQLNALLDSSTTGANGRIMVTPGSHRAGRNSTLNEGRNRRIDRLASNPKPDATRKLVGPSVTLR